MQPNPLAPSPSARAVKRYGPQPALLMVHGTFGSPNEFHPAVAHFQALGFTCYTPSLPAHGRRRKQERLAHLTFEHFTDMLHDEVTTALQAHGQVVLIGHSLGAMLALNCAASLNESASQTGLLGVAALCGAVNDAYLINPRRLLHLPVSRALRALRYVPDYWHGNPRPLFYPWEFATLRRQGYALMQTLQAQLSKVDVPVFLAHSPHDLSVPYQQFELLQRYLQQGACPRLESLELKQCGHQIFPKSREASRVLEQLSLFLDSLSDAG
jgi:pimeloyl-ACP methyl ester carboxylesterase